MPTPTIYFDEAGNTGAALTDSSQPVFVLTSLDLTNEEADSLLDSVRTPQTNEVKFSSLRRTEAGRARLVKLIQSDALTPMRVKAMVTHKRFMIVTKLIDIIEETLAHYSGIDLYERGANIGLSNLRYHVTPVFCGKDNFEELLVSFVEMIRNPTLVSKERFFRATKAVHDNCANEDYRVSWAPYLYAERVIDDILDGVTYLTLDPAIPSFFLHCTEWGAQLATNFHAVHDASKPMVAEKDTFLAMMDPNIEPEIIGYDRRKFEFPLKATGIDFVDSRDYAAIQLADLISGATNYHASAVARAQRDELSDALEAAGIHRFVINALWPSMDVTPEALGTNEVGGINAADHMSDVLSKKRH